MKYIIILILLLGSLKPLSYAKYNWKKKNKLGAVGLVFIAIAAVVFPTVLLFIR